MVSSVTGTSTFSPAEAVAHTVANTIAATAAEIGRFIVFLLENLRDGGMRRTAPCIGGGDNHAHLAAHPDFAG
ncbi:MAG: hypothetical protein JF591_14335 [Lysobacter sp.]|nr:hypothetical protein [Lysobacter sp.]